MTAHPRFFVLADAADPAGHHAPDFVVTLLFTAILVALIACMALEEKIHAKKSLLVAVFSVISLFLGAAFEILPFGAVVNVFDEQISLPVYIPAIDWGVIAIILGSSLFVDVTSRTGLFGWVAIKLTKASGGDPLARFLVEDVHGAEVGRELDLIARLELVSLLEHHRYLLPGQAGHDQDLGTGRLDHGDLRRQIAVGLGQIEMFRSDAVDHLLAVLPANPRRQWQDRAVVGHGAWRAAIALDRGIDEVHGG